jgi:hypothetical protein
MVNKNDEARVIGLFTKEVQEHVEIIEDEIKKGNKDEALLWTNELLAMRDTWAEIAAKRPVIHITDWTGRSATIDTSEAQRLAKLRVNITSAALARLQKKFQSLGWI